MSVEVPNPLTLSPENALPAGAATSDGQDSILSGLAEVRDGVSGPGGNVQELLSMILVELRILNTYLHELPRALNDGYSFVDDETAIRQHLSAEQES